MTVSELIAQLQQYDPDLEIEVNFIAGHTYDGCELQEDSNITLLEANNQLNILAMDLSAIRYHGLVDDFLKRFGMDVTDVKSQT